MVFNPSTYFVAAAIALVALHMQQTTATSLEYDPYTTCDSYDISDDNFPGLGLEIQDDGKCVVTEPKDPKLHDISTISFVPVLDKSLLSSTSESPAEPVYTKVGLLIQSEKKPSEGDDLDAYVTKLESTSPTILTTSTTGRKLEASSNKDIAKLEAYFGTRMETKLKDLPTTAVYSATPWASANWIKSNDSINYEWNQGQPSPAEKYARAFGLDVESFMTNVSIGNGIMSALDYYPECTLDKECYDPNIDTVCAKRPHEEIGVCIPTWIGLCHAWAPAAILEKEPNCPVTHNGVTFQPMDIKALITDAYDGANISTVFTGTRFRSGNDSIDEFGSHTNEKYRTLNPGFFHIAAANILGNLKSTFIIDRDAGNEVWNQPVVGFKVYEQTVMTPEKAANSFYGLAAYPKNENVSSIVYVKSRLSWINETFVDGGLVASGLNQNFTVGTYYDYLLELDEAEDIIGGEWLYESNDIHPDFLWIPKNKPLADTVTEAGLSYANVMMLLEKAVECNGSIIPSVMKQSLHA